MARTSAPRPTTATPRDADGDGHDDATGQFVGGQEARAPDAGETEPVTTDTRPQDPQPPAEAEVEPEREPEVATDAHQPAPAALEPEAAASQPEAAVQSEATAPADEPAEPAAGVGDPAASAEPAGEAAAAAPAADQPLSGSAGDVTASIQQLVKDDDEEEGAAPEPGSAAAFLASQENAPLTEAEAADVTAAIRRILGDAELEPEHIAALGDMQANRYGLYAFPPHGFAVEHGGGYHAAAVVRDLIDAGLAQYEPSGGAEGSAKITPEGSVAYRRARQTALSEA